MACRVCEQDPCACVATDLEKRALDLEKKVDGLIQLFHQLTALLKTLQGRVLALEERRGSEEDWRAGD